MIPHILLHLSIFAYLVIAEKRCYYPSGNLAVDDVPCFSRDTDSPCCSKDSICLSNGLCYGMAQPFALSRGSCTNKDWPIEGGCDDKCSKATALRNGGCALPLFRIEDKKSYYCANSIIVGPSNELACYAGAPFTLDPADLVLDKALLANFTSGDTSSNSTSTSNTTACPTTSSSADKDGDGPTASSSADKAGKGSNDLAIGAGVGIPLGVLLLAALGWAFFERRKRLSAQAMVAGLQSQAAVTYRETQGQTSVYSPPSELSTQKPPQELATTST